MEVATVVSKNGILIRLTGERWKHIVLMHPGLAGKQQKILTTIQNPDCILIMKQLIPVGFLKRK